jgi:hypothetical protein
MGVDNQAESTRLSAIAKIKQDLAWRSVGWGSLEPNRNHAPTGRRASRRF